MKRVMQTMAAVGMMAAGMGLVLTWSGCGSGEEEGEGQVRVASRPTAAVGPTTAQVDAGRMETVIPKDIKRVEELGQAVAATMPDGKLWQRYSNGLAFQDLKPGKGGVPFLGQTMRVNYVGMFPDGKEFDRSRGEAGFEFVLGNVGEGGVIWGWNQIVSTMKVGQKRRVWIPWALAYGERGALPRIPPKQDLIFEIELLEMKGSGIHLPAEPETLPGVVPEGPSLPPATQGSGVQGA